MKYFSAENVERIELTKAPTKTESCYRILPTRELMFEDSTDFLRQVIEHGQYHITACVDDTTGFLSSMHAFLEAKDFSATERGELFQVKHTIGDSKTTYSKFGEPVDFPDVSSPTATRANFPQGGSDELHHVRRLAARAKATSLSQGSRGAGPVSSSADAKATQGGDVEVDAKAIAAAQAEVKNDIAEAIAEAISIVKRGGSASSQASATAEAVGVATARAVAKASVKIDATGSAIGSGAAEASAKSVATVVASAIANAFSSAKGGSSEATSAVKSSVSSSGIARAAARARVAAESKGGSVEVVQVTVSEAVTRVVARAIANALAVVEKDSTVATAGVEATTRVKEQATVDSTSRVTGRGKFPEVFYQETL
ncbi:hypothetical protein BSKO_05674 [Bryopsis sp. KO-2023]|nr:hypothetical protein BSKO_05674 [Bryopsis sp. KO-2023]